jgi:hypothetical protein
MLSKKSFVLSYYIVVVQSKEMRDGFGQVQTSNFLFSQRKDASHLPMPASATRFTSKMNVGIDTFIPERYFTHMGIDNQKMNSFSDSICKATDCLPKCTKLAH